MKQEV